MPVQALEADTVSRKVPTICIGSAMKQGGRSRRATTRVSPGRGGRGRTPFGPVRGLAWQLPLVAVGMEPPGGELPADGGGLVDRAERFLVPAKVGQAGRRVSRRMAR